ncbi:MAG: fumarylacetoacetate hydrolase family protein [Polyangia bacterium]
MKLVTFDAGAGMRPGVVAESAGVGHEAAPILDLPAAFAFLEARSGRASDPASVAARYGAEMLALIECQAAALPAIEELLELYGRGLIPDSDGKRLLLHPRKGVQLLAPIPRPLSMRDGYAFRQHVEAARRNRGLPMIPEFDEFPIFYYTNHLSVIGPGPLRVRPGHLQQLDFELEAAVVLGRGLRNVESDLAAADAAIFGLMVMNDWSARGLQMQEMKLNLGPAKGKDFATALGPYLVPKQALRGHIRSTPRGDQYELKMTARLNGQVVAAGKLSDMSWTFAEIIARASYGVTLHPGEVIGSGTVGTGCFLETNGSKIFDNLWLQVGDRMECEVEELGVLENVVELEA